MIDSMLMIGLPVIAALLIGIAIGNSQTGQILAEELSPRKTTEREIAHEALSTLAGLKAQYGRRVDLCAMRLAREITLPDYITDNHLLGGNVPRVMRVIRKNNPGLPAF